jgi:4-amino-4-deoxy-L-arabinose transferase-like glycosyltransferase
MVPIASTETPRLPDAVAFRPARTDGRDRLALAMILLFALVVRAWLARGSTMENMDPDAAHFLNIARSFATGHGFTNPAAWPAWIQPKSLPMPETLKEPGYPWLIAHLGMTFRAGQALSLLAGVLLPWVAYALGRRRALDRPTALFAALLVAASPLAILQSVRVMVDALFALVVTAMFLFASRDLDGVRPASALAGPARRRALRCGFPPARRRSCSFPWSCCWPRGGPCVLRSLRLRSR